MFNIANLKKNESTDGESVVGDESGGGAGDDDDAEAQRLADGDGIFHPEPNFDRHLRFNKTFRLIGAMTFAKMTFSITTLTTKG
jgi:hypothetical protein